MRSGTSVHTLTRLLDVGSDQLRFDDGTTLESALAETIPRYVGPEVVRRSGLGDEAGFLPDRHHEPGWPRRDPGPVRVPSRHQPTAKCGPLAHLLEGSLDLWISHSSGHLPPDEMQSASAMLLRV